MKLKCSLCDMVKVSQIIGDPESSFKELCNKLTKHFQIKHPQELSQFQTDIQILTTKTLSCFSMMSTIDLESEETDKWIKDNFERENEDVLEMMGWVDDEGIEEGETEEENEEFDKQIENAVLSVMGPHTVKFIREEIMKEKEEEEKPVDRPLV